MRSILEPAGKVRTGEVIRAQPCRSALPCSGGSGLGGDIPETAI